MNSEHDQRRPVTILVTGGCGYLGSQLIRDLPLDERLGNVTVRILDNLQSGRHEALFDLPGNRKYQFIEGDILDTSTLHLALRGVDAVVHLAAVARTPMCFENPTWLEQVNHWGTARLVESCLEANVSRFILASSAAVYGPGGPFTESHPCRPVSPYGQSKYGAEKTVLSARERGLRPTVLRIGILFGLAPVTRFDAVINRMAFLAGARRSLTVYGDGQQRRPFIHVRDASEAICDLLASSHSDKGEILNVLSTNAAVVDIVDEIRQLRADTPVRFTEQDMLTHVSMELDSARALSCGWKPRWTLEKGIREMLEKFNALRTSFSFSMETDVS